MMQRWVRHYYYKEATGLEKVKVHFLGPEYL